MTFVLMEIGHLSHNALQYLTVSALGACDRNGLIETDWLRWLISPTA